MKKYYIEFSPLSREDIIDIWGYISFDNEEAANQCIEHLHSKISTLADFPFLGVQRDEFLENERFLVFKKYNIYYRVNENTVFIRRILHGSREIKNFL